MASTECTLVNLISKDKFAAVRSDDDYDEVVEEEESRDDEDVDNGLDRAKRQKVEICPEGFSSTGSLPEKKICKHPGFVKELCITCGQRVEADSCTVPLTYIKKDITMSIAKDEMAQVRDKDLKNLLESKCRGKKLYLVLDLDHTLFNSARLTDIEEKEEAYFQRDDLPGTLKDSLIRLDEIKMMTKLRPFVHTFLEEAHKLFEMYIYTMADRDYAEKMAKLLDPKGEYFQSRIISCDDGTRKDQKGLDIFLEEESTVIILDNTKEVWKANTDNLLLSDRYHFFASSCKRFGLRWDSFSQRNTDERETEGTLATVLKVLKQIHSLFFDEGCMDEDRDVRRVIKTLRREVLKGCRIAFSRIYPKKSTPQHDPLWIMAEELGATCLPDVDSSVTHVVNRDAGTEKSKRAVGMNKFLVNRRWIETSYYLWRKQPEDQFLLTKR